MSLCITRHQSPQHMKNLLNLFRGAVMAALRSPETTYLEVKGSVAVEAKVMLGALYCTVISNKQETFKYPLDSIPYNLMPKWYKRMAAA